MLREKEIKDAQQREEKQAMMAAALEGGEDIEIASDDEGGDYDDDGDGYGDAYEDSNGAYDEAYEADEGYAGDEGGQQYGDGEWGEEQEELADGAAPDDEIYYDQQQAYEGEEADGAMADGGESSEYYVGQEGGAD